MIRVALLLAALLDPSSTNPGQPTEASVVVEPLVAAIAADDLQALAALAEAETFASPRWRSAIDVVERLDDITVASHRIDSQQEDAGGVRSLWLELTGSGRTLGALRAPAQVPRWWQLQVVAVPGAGWKVRSALTLERALAQQLANADERTIGAAVAREPRLDLASFRLELADLAPEHGEAGRAAGEWAAAAARAAGDAAGEAWVHARLVPLELGTGKPAEVVVRAELALAAARRAADPDALATATFAVAIGHWFRDDVAAAVSTMLDSAAGIESVRDPRVGMRGLYMASLLENREGRLPEALAIAARLRDYLDRWPWRRGEMDLQVLLGSVYSTVGNLELAAEAYALAQQAAVAVGDGRAQALLASNLAIIQREIADGTPAAPWSSRALALARRHLQAGERAMVLVAASEELGERGDLRQAEALVEEAAAIATAGSERRVLASTLAARSQLRRQLGKLEPALRDAEQALTHAKAGESTERTSLRLDLGEVHLALGQALRAVGRTGEAERAFRTAIAEVEQWHAALEADALGRSRYLTGRQQAFRELADLLAASGRAEEALAVVERAKARALADTIAGGGIDLSAALTSDERRREAELEQALVAANRALLAEPDPAAQSRLVADRDRARLALERLRADLHLKHPELRRRRPALLERPQQDWLRAVPRDGAVVELMLAEDHTLAFVVPGRGARPLQVRVRRLPVGAAAVTSRIDDFVAKLAARHPGYVEQARALYDLLWRPLEPDLAGVTAVAVVPDGALWRLPFASLRDPSGRELAGRLAIFRVPSLWALGGEVDGRPRQRRSPRLLALANPAVPGAAARRGSGQRGPVLAPLPDAEDEVRRIGRMYGSGRADVLVGAAARERAFKEAAGNYDVVHLATHGLLDDRAPMFSALLLAAAAADGEDGLLEVREIAGLRLRADVVVLAACDTGRGALRAGEGIVGMSWALLAAGAPTAVVGDWKADSAATSRLMVEFHRHLLAGVPAAESLRRAQLALAGDPRFAHPYYWAPFVVVGNGWQGAGS